jgi:hypothetical protein
MKKILFAFLLALFSSLPAFAQCANYTQVSATVTDPNSTAWANGTVTADLFPSGGSPTCTPAFGGTNLPFTTHIGPTPLNSSGIFSMQVPTSANIQPGGTQWTFTVLFPGVAPPVGTGPQLCIATVTISGTSQSLNANFSGSACPKIVNITSTSGGVSSVGLSMMSWLTVTGTPITTSGTFVVAPATGQTSHQFIGTCGSATSFTPCSIVLTDLPTIPYSSISGTPTATSVALTVPSWLSVSGSPVAPAGTLAVSPTGSQTSHQVIGTCGSLATFQPCSLVAADLPTIPYSQLSGTPTPTSVGLTVPSWLSVSGSPVAPSGTLAVSPATGQPSHEVIGTCGSATSFAPCTLAPSDIPAGTSTVYNTAISEAGASVPSTNMVTAPAADTNYFFNVNVSQTAATSGCSTQPSIAVVLTYTDAGTNGARSLNVGLWTLSGPPPPTDTVNFSGTVSGGTTWYGFAQLRAKASTVVSYNTLYTIGSGCTTGATYLTAPVLVQE